jgi:MYXO-CTERM domain-containing protein
MRVVGFLAVVACVLDGGTSFAQEVVTHPDVVYFPTRPAGDLLGRRDDTLIAVHPEYRFSAGIPALVSSTAAGILPVDSVGCMPSGLATREAWRIHFAPNADARTLGVLAFRDHQAVGVSFSQECIEASRSPLGGLLLPDGALAYGLERDDALWRSASGQFFAASFLALAGEIDDTRVLAIAAVGEELDMVAACVGSDPALFDVDLTASSTVPAHAEIVLLALGATGCNLGGVGCRPAAGGLFACPASMFGAPVMVSCGGSPERTVVIAAPSAEDAHDTDPTNNVCEVAGGGVLPDGGGDLDGGTGLVDAGDFDGSIPGRDAAIVAADGANLVDARIGSGRDASRRDSDLGSGGGGPSFQGGGGCMCSTGGDASSLAWAALLALWVVRRSRVR